MRRNVVLVVLALAALGQSQSLRWAWRHNGRFNRSDIAYSLFENSAGNATLVGSGYDTLTSTMATLLVELSSSGSQTWVGTLESIYYRNAVRASGGRVLVAGVRYGDEADASIICHSVGGSKLWEYDWDAPHLWSQDECRYVCEGPWGNIYGAGRSDRWMELWALSSAGQLIDRIEFWGPESAGVSPAAICAGPDGGVYIAGSTIYQGKTWIYVYKYGSWVRMINLHGYVDAVYKMTVGPAGGLYLAGITGTGPYTGNLLVTKLSEATGDPQWTYEYSRMGRTDIAQDICFDDQGNAYVCGFTSDPTTAADIIVVSITGAGTERWVYRYAGPVASDDKGMAVDIGTDGNLYVFGPSTGPAWDMDMVALSLTPSGSERWVYRYDAGSNEFVQPFCGYAGADGNLVMAGSGTSSSGDRDMVAVSVNPAGAVTEAPALPSGRSLTAPTVVRGRLELACAGTLFDIAGRPVGRLRAGCNDISRLAAGAYVLCSDDKRPAATSRLLLVP